MNILITGTNGYIGTKFSEYVKKYNKNNRVSSADHQAVTNAPVTAHNSSGSVNNSNRNITYNVEYISLRDDNWKNADLSNTDVILHTAAIVHRPGLNGPEAEVRVGNCLPLANIPVGTQVHNIELHPGKGGQLVRSAGMSAQLMAKEGKYATLRLPSGEMRMVPLECRASIGVVGNGDHNLINIGKAGRTRHMGIRPTVRGSVMNPNDHPHGGGEGKTGIGRPGPCTPWGKPALGLKTRKKNKASNKMIVRRRDGKSIK